MITEDVCNRLEAAMLILQQAIDSEPNEEVSRRMIFAAFRCIDEFMVLRSLLMDEAMKPLLIAFHNAKIKPYSHLEDLEAHVAAMLRRARNE